MFRWPSPTSPRQNICIGAAYGNKTMSQRFVFYVEVAQSVKGLTTQAHDFGLTA